MASPIKNLRLSPDLVEIAETRARALGYATWSDYVRALIRYDAMVQGGHGITLPISKLSLMDQDGIDAKLAHNVKEGIQERGQFLGKLVKKLIADGKDVTDENIVKNI